MSSVTRLVLLKGTTAQRSAFTPLQAEIVFDTSLNQVFVGDGATPGGNPLTAEANIQIEVRNNTGATLLKGSAVYISGVSAGKPTVELASNNEINSDFTIGIVKNDILNNTDGVVLVFGVISGINTSSFTEGDELFVGVGGAITNVAPISPAHRVSIGYALTISPSIGNILVEIKPGAELGKLHDVLIGNLQNGQVLTYNSSTLVWENKSIPEYYETVSKNLKSWDATFNYTAGQLTSIVYTSGLKSITKTFNYTGGNLTSIVLSGDTPLGILLTKTLSYTGNELTGVSYS